MFFLSPRYTTTAKVFLLCSVRRNFPLPLHGNRKFRFHRNDNALLISPNEAVRVTRRLCAANLLSCLTRLWWIFRFSVKVRGSAHVRCLSQRGKDNKELNFEWRCFKTSNLWLKWEKSYELIENSHPILSFMFQSLDGSGNRTPHSVAISPQHSLLKPQAV